MNFVVSAALSAKNVEEVGDGLKEAGKKARTGAKVRTEEGTSSIAAPLFVQPLHKVGDFGKMGKTGLHLKKSHLTTRSDCLNKMNTVFFEATGENLPIQKQVVDVVSWGGGAMANLTKKRYNGLFTRLHEDCLVMGVPRNQPSSATKPDEEACSWQLPPLVLDGEGFQARSTAGA